MSECKPRENKGKLKVNIWKKNSDEKSLIQEKEKKPEQDKQSKGLSGKVSDEKRLENKRSNRK